MSISPIQSARAWAQLENHHHIAPQHNRLSPAQQQALRHAPRWHEAAARLAATDLLNRLPYKVYRPITDILKRLRNQTRPPSEFSFRPNAYMELAAPANSPQPFFISLTHDIDTAAGADFWHRVTEIEAEYNVRSTSNVLTKGPYTLPADWLDDLIKQGFEIGLHGDTHDMAIGFRRESTLRHRLERSLESLNHPIKGFRAPAYGFSERLLALLAELGFRYDSSVRLRLFFQKGVETSIPYIYPGTNLWEFPLAISDDALFRDAGVSDRDALTIITQLIELLQPFGGVFVLNTHPIHLINRSTFYRDVLAYLQDQALPIRLLGDLASQLDQRLEAHSSDIS